jgi:ornithine cyclodeaminase/alanine dehydrogenase-like protein (mu-crystallin family)
MQVFDTAATEAALPFDRLQLALQTMFVQGCEVPPRHVHRITGDQAPGTVLIMPAWTPTHLGIKTVNIFPDNHLRGLPGLFSVYTLFDATTGQPLAQMDGDVITARRTAAASALAARCILRADAAPRSLLVVGTGRVGSLLPPAYAHAMRLQRVAVWDRRPEKAAALAARLCVQGLPAAAVTDLPDAVARADVVCCATLAREPVVQGAWLRPGSHLDLIGSFTPEMREADDDAFRNAVLFVDTPEALQKSGDLLGPLARGVFRAGDVAGTLAQLCRGEVRAPAPGQRTVFKSVGTALEDLAAAVLVYTTGVPSAPG